MMNERALLALLRQVQIGDATPEEAAAQLRIEPFVSLGYATVDSQRKARQGIAEVIYGASKTPEQILGICQTMVERGEHNILVTRMQLSRAAQAGRCGA